jgi:DMSO reductase family type II enzyme chaperone
MTAYDLRKLQCLARSRIYAHLAAFFRYPDLDSWDVLTGKPSRESFAEACKLLAEEKGYTVLRRHRNGFPRKRCGTLDEFQDLYQAVFGHTVSKEFPPYETEYGNMHLFQQSDFLADLSGFYHAFGMQVRERVERLDHISIQLEFLHFLTFKEAHAHEYYGEEQVQICREAQTSFFEDHLGRWGETFAKRLERRDPDGPFGGASRLLLDFLGAEKTAFSTDADPVPDISRGELLPAVADEWNASEWLQNEDS